MAMLGTSWVKHGRALGFTTWPQNAQMEAWADYAACYACFLGLQLMDLMVTLAVLAAGGGEANPIAVSFLQYGPSSLLAFKLCVILLTMLVWVPAVAWLARQDRAVQRWASPTVNALVLALVVYYAAVVFYNMANLALLRA